MGGAPEGGAAPTEGRPVDENLAKRLWNCAARMAFDGCSALEDLLASEVPPHPDELAMIAILVQRVLRVSREVERRAHKKTGDP